jgi:hypothetical protein
MSFVQQALVVRGGEGEVVTALGSRYLYKVLGGSTAGAFSLVEETLVATVPVQRREGEDLDDDAVTALAAAHGCRIVGPPLDTAT